MKKVSISAIANTLRYRAVVIDNNETYIVDLDSSIVTIALPFLSPFFKKKYYPISEEEFNNIKTLLPKAKYRASSLIGISFLGVVLARNMPVGIATIQSPILKLLLLLLVVGLPIMIRIKIHKTPKFISQYLEIEPQKMKVRYTDLKLLTIYLIMLVSMVGMFILSKQIVNNTNSTLIEYLMLGFSFCGYLLTSLLFNNVGHYTL